MTRLACDRRDEMIILGIIVVGIIAVLLSIVLGLFIVSSMRANVALPNWAENVLVAVATAAALKLGDCISALVALATGRQVESFGTKLADSQPKVPDHPVPENAKEAAEQVSDAAAAEAERIGETK